MIFLQVQTLPNKINDCSETSPVGLCTARTSGSFRGRKKGRGFGFARSLAIDQGRIEPDVEKYLNPRHSSWHRC
jgi:hypothetical protein